MNHPQADEWLTSRGHGSVTPQVVQALANAGYPPDKFTDELDEMTKSDAINTFLGAIYRELGIEMPETTKPVPKPVQAPADPAYQKRAAILFVFVVILAAAYTGLLTNAGNGASTYRALAGMRKAAKPCVGLAALILVALYFLDARQWQKNKIVMYLALATVGFLVFLYMLFSTITTPYNPIVLFLLFCIPFFVAVKMVLFEDDHPGNFISSLGWPLIVVGLLYLIGTVSVQSNYLGDHSSGSNETRLAYTSYLMDGCKGDNCPCAVVQPLCLKSELAEEELIAEDAGDDDVMAKQFDDGTGTCIDNRELCEVPPAKKSGTEPLEAADPSVCISNEISFNDKTVCSMPRNSQDQQPVNYCTAAWVLWANPNALAICWIFIGWGALVVGGFSKNTAKTLGDKDLLVYLGVLGLAFFLFWVALAIGGAIMGLMAVASRLTTVVLAIFFTMAGFAMGWDLMGQTVLANAMVQRMVGYGKAVAYNDWFRAILMDFLFLGVAAAFVVSAINQFVRKTFKTKIMTAKEQKSGLTAPMDAVAADMKTWPWTSVLTKMITLGVFYFFMSVIVAKLTVVFFAWLNMAVADWPLVAVSVLYIFVGLTNFLNPACPATPVYLTGGIVVGHASEVFFSKSVCTDDLGCASFGDAESCRNSGHGANCQWGGECVRTCQSGFWVGAVYTTITVFLLKLCAIVGEQKGIGENLGKLLFVRKTINVNSTPIRAFQMVLEQRGLGWKKVMILVGGPDWPISVLTGILRLNVWQMILGSTPFYFMVAPVVLSGSFVVKIYATAGTAEYFMWTSTGLVMGSMAALITTGMAFGCFIVVEWATAFYKDEIAAMPDDQEVKEAQEKDAVKAEIYARATAWVHVPSLYRGILVLGALMMIGSCAMFAFAGSACFAKVDVSMDVHSQPLCVGKGGGYMQLVKPAGYLAMGLQAGGVLCLMVFKNWAGGRVETVAAQDAGGADAPGSPSTPTFEMEGDLARSDSYTPPVMDPQADQPAISPLRRYQVGNPLAGADPGAVAAGAAVVDDDDETEV